MTKRKTNEQKRDEAFFNAKFEEAKQADNLDTFYRDLRNELKNSTDPVYSKPERKDFVKRLKSKMRGKERSTLPAIISELKNVITKPGGKAYTLEDIGDMKLANLAEPTDIAIQDPERFGQIEIFLKALQGQNPAVEEWLTKVIATAKSQAAQSLRTLSIAEPFHPYSEVDLRLFENRAAYYDYWEGVAEIYNPRMHHSFLRALKQDGVDEGLEKKIDQLMNMVPPPMTMEVKPVEFYSEGNRMPEVLDAFLDRILDKDDNIFFETGGYFETTEDGKRTGSKVGEIDDTKYKTTDKDIQHRMKQAKENLEGSRVDPLLWYSVQEGKVAVPFTLQSWEELSKNFSDEIENVLVSIDKEIYTEFLEFANELHDAADDAERDIYHLPIGDGIEGEVHFIDRHGPYPEDEPLQMEIKDLIGEQTEFFRILGSIIKEVPDRFSIEQHKVKVGMGDPVEAVDAEKGKANALATLLSSATEISYPKKKGQDLTMTPSTQQKFQDLLDVLIEYYIEPLRSDYFYEGKPRFEGLSGFQSLILRAENHPMQKRVKRIQNANVKNFSVDDVEQINEFLDAMEVRTSKFDSKMEKLGDDAIKGLDSVLGRDEEHRVFIGSLLGTLADYQEQDVDAIQFAGKSLRYWMDIQEDSPSQTLTDLHNFFESAPIKTNLFIRDTTKPIQEALIIKDPEIGDKESRERKLFEEIKKLVTKIIQYKKSLDPIAMKLLHAHDVIRKMLGKKLSYAKFNINDPDHMDMLMQKVPITAPEISTIVKSYDSHRNLSLNYGISEDDVYMIKGLCR